MNIDWNPSSELLKKIKEVRELRKTHSCREIGKKLNISWQYVYALLDWDKKAKGGDVHEK